MSRVYFLVDSNIEDNIETVKIGVSNELVSRKQVFQTGNPKELYFLSYLEGDYELEQMFHEYFSKYKIHGEWFTYQGEFRKRLDLLLKHYVKMQRNSETSRECLLMFKLYLERELQILKL